MSSATPGTRRLAQLGIAFTLYPYTYDPTAERVGLQAAEALGKPPQQVFKTLMVEVDGKPACTVLPSDKELSMKKVAAAFGGKSAEMMKPPVAERLTGYKVGGISPFGQKKIVRTVIDASAFDFATVLINAGQRGLLLEITPQDAQKSVDALSASVTA